MENDAPSLVDYCPVHGETSNNLYRPCDGKYRVSLMLQCCQAERLSYDRVREREPNTQINTTDVPRSHTTHNRHVWMTPHVSECRGRGEGAVISLSHYPLYVCVHNESVYTCRHDKRRPRGFVCVTAAVGQVHTGKPAPPRGDRWPL